MFLKLFLFLFPVLFALVMPVCLSRHFYKNLFNRLLKGKDSNLTTPGEQLLQQAKKKNEQFTKINYQKNERKKNRSIFLSLRSRRSIYNFLVLPSLPLSLWLRYTVMLNSCLCIYRNSCPISIFLQWGMIGILWCKNQRYQMFQKWQLE